MLARDVMTTKVRTVRPDASVRDVVRTMVQAQVSAVPVIDGRRRVLGIVSEGDLMRRAETGTGRRRSWWSALFADTDTRAREYVKSRGLRAQDVMTRSVISVTESADLVDVADVMEEWNIKRVPVVRGGKLVGIVSRRDLVRAVLRSPRKRGRGKVSDAAIHERLRQEVSGSDVANGAFANFVVDKGVVELYGLVPSQAQRDALRVMAEGVAGVKSVKDRLAVRPLSGYAD